MTQEFTAEPKRLAARLIENPNVMVFGEEARELIKAGKAELFDTRADDHGVETR